MSLCKEVDLVKVYSPVKVFGLEPFHSYIACELDNKYLLYVNSMYQPIIEKTKLRLSPKPLDLCELI